MKKYLIKASSIFVLFMFLLLNGPAQMIAAGTTGPTGVQGNVGTTTITGPQIPVGPTQPTGAQSGPAILSENSVTGPNSLNTTDVQTNQNTNANIENNSDVNNGAEINVDTGSNTVDNNTSAGDMTTGDANVGLNIINASNSILNPGSTYGSSNIAGGTNLSLGTPENRVSFENFLTGPGSENSNLVDMNGNLAINEVYNSEIDNEIRVDINTGENQINGNTCIGDIITGDIRACINLLNLSNIVDPLLTIAVDSWNILGDVNGNITFENSTTGPESANSNALELENNMNINSTNNSNIVNNAEINTNTGANNVGQNTLIGDVATGVANVKESVINFANVIASPVFYVFNVFGQFTGDLAGLGLDPNYVFINEITGPESDNTNAISAQNNVDINLENNSEINNNILINANTGRNNIGNNTAVGNVQTGSIDVGLNLINLSNVIGKDAKNFCLRIINIFGDWNCNDTEEPGNEQPGEEEVPNAGGIVSPPVVAPSQPELQQAVLGNQLSRFETPAVKSIALVKGEELGNPPVAGPSNNYNQLFYALLILLALSGAWAGFEILTYKKK